MSVLIERSDGYKILCDPYLSDNPATKTTPDDVRDVDLLVVTHNAFDHFGDTIEIMQKGNARLIAGGEVIRRVQEAIPDIDPKRMHLTIYGDEQNYNGTIIRVTPTWHVSNCVVNGMTIANPPFGFILDIEDGASYFHVGDTSLFSDFKMLSEMYRPNIMAVGISSINKAIGYPCEMNPREAAYATQWVGPNVVIPTHYAPGDPALDEYLSYVKVTAPKTVVKKDIDTTWTYTPFKVE